MKLNATQKKELKDFLIKNKDTPKNIDKKALAERLKIKVSDVNRYYRRIVLGKKRKRKAETKSVESQ